MFVCVELGWEGDVLLVCVGLLGDGGVCCVVYVGLESDVGDFVVGVVEVGY